MVFAPEYVCDQVSSGFYIFANTRRDQRVASTLENTDVE